MFFYPICSYNQLKLHSDIQCIHHIGIPSGAGKYILIWCMICMSY